MDTEKILDLFLHNPEAAVALLKPIINKYKSAIYSICDEVWNICKDFANNDEIYAVRASAKRKTYDSLIQVGFTSDQAMALMINDNLHRIEALKHTSASTKTLTKSK